MLLYNDLMMFLRNNGKEDGTGCGAMATAGQRYVMLCWYIIHKTAAATATVSSDWRAAICY
jgi:riboflavin transporter FmnP